MTPLQIEMILWFGTRTSPRDDLHNSAQREEVAWMLREDLIEPATNGDGAAIYRLMPRGLVFFDALCALPLPVFKWEMPS